MQGALKEEGDIVKDGFVLIEPPGLAKLTGKVQKISDVLDLIPLYNRKGVELSVTHAVSEGLDAFTKCVAGFERKLADQEYHQDWLKALKAAVADDEQELSGTASRASEEQNSSSTTMPVDSTNAF